MSFGVSFDGRLRKVRPAKTKSINALFEAVANSFDSTEQLGKAGNITVRILKRNPKLFAIDAKAQRVKLDGYESEDNGVGFNDKNLKHFKTADTTNKPGGLGVGRFTWLHVFEYADIESTYKSGKKTGRGLIGVRAVV
ncbi:ATP-binding protein [Limnoglobus roseus]|nr:ATP-binding protein [Limnoglobus roseus]